jgi:penicillin-binding protein 1A
VLAMASSTHYASDQFNIAAEGHRQPGSAFKPFVLATALKQGVNPYKTFYDGSSPVTLYPYGHEGEPWTVNNAEPGEGRMSVAQATTDSVNSVYAQLDLDVGPENVAATAQSLGITSPLDGFPSEGIGGLRVGVSPLEMSDAYATFADGGVHHPSSAIDEVDFPGHVDRLGAPTPTRALAPALAAEETQVLKTVIASGTGTAADIGCPAAGKTGTTDEQTDAWFVGYTPRISTAVWTGYPPARESMGPSAFGGSYAAPIWQQFMDAARGGYCGDFGS